MSEPKPTSKSKRPASQESGERGATAATNHAFEPLPMTSYAVLGLLSPTNEYTAVEVKARAHEFIRFFYWTPALSHIRRELDRLEELGFVAVREVPKSRLKSTLTYRMTEAGEQNLSQWAGRAPLEPPVVKNSVLLRLWLARRASDKDGFLDLLQSCIDQTVKEREELTALIDRVVERHLTPSGPPITAWAVEVLRFTRETYDHNIKTSRDLLDSLKQLDMHAET